MADTSEAEIVPVRSIGKDLLRCLKGFWAALPDWAIALPLLLVWVSPGSFKFGRGLVDGIIPVFVVEFMTMHSAVFSATIVTSDRPLTEKIKKLLGISLLYGVVVFGTAYGGKSWGLLWMFLGIVVSRFVKIFVRLSDADKNQLTLRSALSGLVLLFLMFASLLPFIPPWGIEPRSGEGLWDREPHRVFFMMTTYFSLLGLYEFMVVVDPEYWAPRPKSPKKNRK